MPARALGGPIEIWFQDEARVGQKGTHAYVWAPIGSRPLMVRDNRHDSAYIFGAICPDRAVGAAIVMPEVNAEAMSHHLKVIGAEVSPLAHAVLICDGAGWHQTGGTIARTRQHHPAALAALLSRTELDGVWHYLRENILGSRVWDTYDDIVEACCAAWRFLTDDPARIRSIGRRAWASVSL